MLKLLVSQIDYSHVIFDVYSLYFVIGDWNLDFKENSVCYDPSWVVIMVDPPLVGPSNTVNFYDPFPRKTFMI